MSDVLGLDSQQPDANVFPHLLMTLQEKKAKSRPKRVERKEYRRFWRNFLNRQPGGPEVVGVADERSLETETVEVVTDVTDLSAS